MKKMNVHLLTLALLAFALGYGSEARAIDENIDNSIEASGGAGIHQSSSDSLLARTRLGLDWIKFTKVPPVKIIQRFGSPIEISCEVMGSPVPTIQWVVGNIPLSEIETIESNVISETSTNAIVKARSIHVIEHALTEPLTYTCVGNTGFKTIYASTTVYPHQSELGEIVRVNNKHQIKPRIVYHEKMHLDLEGSNVVLPCKVHARPKAEVFWMNEDGALVEQNQHFNLLPSGELLIAGLKWEDMGTYKCIARNAWGKDTADTFVYPVKKDI